MFADAQTNSVRLGGMGPVARSARLNIQIMVGVESDPNRSLPGRWRSIFYVALITLVAVLFGVSLAVVRIRGGFVFPPWFGTFRILFYVQFGMFGGACLSFLLYFLPRIGAPAAVKVPVFGCFIYLTGWLCAWGLTQSAYGIELTGRTLIELFTNPVAFGEMGLGPREFTLIAIASILFIAALTAAAIALASRIQRKIAFRIFVACLVLFLALHIPVRAYIVHYINRGNYAILVYDDCAPLPLRTERFVPGVRPHRFRLPSFENAGRTKAYFDFMDKLPMPAIPQPRNILWINVESLRADAINERAMPRLFAWRDQFQVRLDKNHWSGGNATQFGIFSMLTGLSGTQFGDSLRAKRSAPFLTLLDENKYRMRVASHIYMKYGGLYRLLPASTTVANFVVRRQRDDRDRRMVELYLEDRRNRDSQTPTFDFLTFDATHWPYFYPPGRGRFQPDPLVTASLHVLRGQTDLNAIRNRYDNACDFVDEHIAMVLEDLKARGEFDNTIVLIAGDHGEEFQERGQITHSAGLNDFQGRTVLWMHFPEPNSQPVNIDRPTVHMDIVPTLLQALGFSEDILYTQGQSLLSEVEPRPALPLCEQGFTVPLYRALVTDTYISRWLRTPRRFLFSGVQRRDGAPVKGRQWLKEARALTPAAAAMYELPPDTSQPPRRFQMR